MCTDPGKPDQDGLLFYHPDISTHLRLLQLNLYANDELDSGEGKLPGNFQTGWFNADNLGRYIKESWTGVVVDRMRGIQQRDSKSEKFVQCNNTFSR